MRIYKYTGFTKIFSKKDYKIEIEEGVDGTVNVRWSDRKIIDMIYQNIDIFRRFWQKGQIKL
jgi:hypothetical protein